MNIEDHIKLFGMSHALVERELDKVEKSHRLDLQREVKDDRDQDYYPQLITPFESKLPAWRGITNCSTALKKTSEA